MVKIFRVFVIAVVMTTFLNAIVFIGIGIFRSIHAYIMIGTNGLAGKPGIEIAESVDSFLISLVFIITSVGFMKLFIPDLSWMKGIDLPWLKIDKFSQLESHLWHSVSLTLLILFAVGVINAEEDFTWTTLVMPGCLLLISLAGKFLHE
jgi:uncharacterized membrane protein YqhA